jgi:hypothetical protein
MGKMKERERDVRLNSRGQINVKTKYGGPIIKFKVVFNFSNIAFFFLNRPLLPCGVEGFLLVNLLDNW